MSEECTHDCSNCGAACSSRDAAPQHDAPNPNSSVKKVIGVVSGKGGVGKSMTSALLACAMARRGYHCGILDADITGPSIPKLFGIHGRAMAERAEKMVTVCQELVGYLEDIEGAAVIQREIASIAMEMKEIMPCVTGMPNHSPMGVLSTRGLKRPIMTATGSSHRVRFRR